MARSTSRTLPWTDDRAAARLLAADPFALLVGFLLDQQVPMEWAFGAPYQLRKRLGGKLTARRIADMESEELVQLFLARPPLHRYPASMARRTQTLARRLLDEYGGDAARTWSDGADAAEVSRRIARLPGFSANKASVIIGVLAKRLGVEVPGWEKLAPTWFSLADVDSPQALLRYRDIKRTRKAAGDWPPGSAKRVAKPRPGAKPQPGAKRKRGTAGSQPARPRGLRRPKF